MNRAAAKERDEAELFMTSDEITDPADAGMYSESRSLVTR